MTLVLKSNIRAKNSIGNVHGWTGPNDYVAMLDFNRGEYFTVAGGERTDLPITDAITLSRASLGAYTGRDGVRRVAATNGPRLQYLSEYDMVGLAVDNSVTNLASSDSDGTSVSFPSSALSTGLFVSFAGTGDVVLTSPNVALAESWVQEDGRQFRRYTKSITAAFTATLAVTGVVSDVDVVEGAPQRVFMGHSANRATETVALGAAVRGLVSSAGTILYRAIYWPRPISETRAGHFVSVKSGVAQGGLYLGASSPKTSLGTDEAKSAPDGALVNASVRRVHTTGNWRDQHVKGLAWRDFGDDMGLVTYGQYRTVEGTGVTISAISDIFVGGDTGSTNINSRLGGVITHIVAYDRMLEVDEGLAAANVGLF